MKNENNALTIIENKAHEIAKNGLFDLSKITDVETLSAVAMLSETSVNKTQLWQAKALQKIREIFAKEKKLVSARNKVRAKHEPKKTVNIYGCETFTEYAEKMLNIPKSTANTLANLARLLDESGLHSIFFGNFGDKDFGFAQLLKLSPYVKTDENGKITENPVKTFKLSPDMTVKQITDILTGKQIEMDETETDETAETAETAETETDETAETAETAKEETPKEYAVKLTANEIDFLHAILRETIDESETETAIKTAGAILTKIEKSLLAKK